MARRGREWSRKADRDIMNVVMRRGGRARWKDFESDPVVGSWSPTKIRSYLDRAVKLGALSRRLERSEKRPGYTYLLKPRALVEIFNKMSVQLKAEAERLYVATQQPDLTVTDRGKRLIDGVHELLAYQKALTLMAMKLAMSAPTEDKAAHRFLVLMDTFTPDAAGNALWLCWLNKDIAAGVLEAMLPKPEA